ncbi:MAG: hypothetical protein AB7X49_11565, partial [Geminicoccaceae bacterium]
MTEPAIVAAPKKRGPSTAEGKARSKMNALRHGLRARAFGLLPEEDPGEWAVHLLEVRAGLGPKEPFEEQLATAVAVAMWLEIRADRVECDVMAEIPPLPNRSHGGDLQEPRHAASLGTAVRYRTGAGMATQRAQRAFYAYRKAKKDGLVAAAAVQAEGVDGRALSELPEPAPASAAPCAAAPCAAALCEDAAPFVMAEPGPAAAAAQICTNELPPDPAEPEAAEPDPAAADPAEPEAPVLGRRAAGSGAGLAEADWLASLPVVEPDPEREARRRELLLQLEPPILRRAMFDAGLKAVEQLLLPDMAAYEQWFARQPKPEQVPASTLGPEHAAMVEEVTRHNPPWLRGEYLSYWRKPVPKELFDQPGTMPECAAPPPPAPASITTPLAALRARLARLLDRKAQRRLDELELAEAVCALRWPHWGPYRGPLDLDLLRRALDGTQIDGKTLTWLDSHAFA